MMRETSWQEYHEGASRYRIRARYGMDYAFARKFSQAPHFSLTGEVERKAGRRWVEDSGGAIHEQLVEHFPDLSVVVPWHLVSAEGPMHYYENAKYWWDMQQGRVKREPYEPDPVEAFKRTIVFGSVEGDGDRLPPLDTPWVDVRRWLELRKPDLIENFLATMAALDVLE